MTAVTAVLTPLLALVTTLAVLAVLVVAVRLAPAVTMPARVPGSTAPRRRGRRRPTRPWARRAPEPDDDAVAGWCERVAAAVRSGSSLTRAVTDEDEVGVAPFADVGHAIRRGRPLGEAFGTIPGDPTTAVGLATPVLTTCAQLGGPAAGPLEHVAAVLASRVAERAERQAASAQARLSARVLTIVPLGVLGVLVVAEPSIRRTLVTSAGAACLLAGGALDLCGWWWMRRMIERAT